MKKEFINDFFETRDDTLQDIKESSYNWNKFINYWSKILDEYSVDNVLNLYSYNPYGKIFKTFDDWNNDKIERRIKPKSKGIPIIEDDNVYLFAYNDKVYIKRLIMNINELVIKSDNADKETYRTQYISDERIEEVRILGKVVGLFRSKV